MFDLQAIRDGVDVVHMNLYQARIRPNRGARLPSATELANNMPRFMRPTPASVRISTNSWKGSSTLVFRANVPMPLYLFIPSMTLPGVSVPVPVPDKLRHIKMPHTDVVGIAAIGNHGFTVETLTRRFEDSDDDSIRTTVRAVVLAAAPLGIAMEPLVENYLVEVNRHHFLAGRRAFYMRPLEDGDWMFETAAIERFSRKEFKLGVQAAYGKPEDAVNPIWLPMVKEVGNFYGRTTWYNFWNSRSNQVEDVASNPYYKQISNMSLLS